MLILKDILKMRFLFVWIIGLTILFANTQPQHVWVFFNDKGPHIILEKASILTQIESELDSRTKWLRSKVRTENVVNEKDIPVFQEYKDLVTNTGAKWRTNSKWLNAVSVSATNNQISQIEQFPFVKSIQRVRAGKRKHIQSTEPHLPPSNRTEYGSSWDQLNQINVISAHDSGYTGQGVRVLMLDTGYFTDHESIHEDQIIAEWDFINNDGETQNEEFDPEGQHDHGTFTLSTLGGSYDGNLYGPAYNAEFLLAKTEDISQEQPIEEDWYVAGLEWGEELGADIASSSLGYIDWYNFEDLDGQTAVTTIAVNLAIENGMIITTAAGNDGEEGIIAPADALDVITCGAVDEFGTLAYFSSWGPTADGRTKPEVCARGYYTYCASSNGVSEYTQANGTSLSTPLIGGACAIILSAHPEWTPQMVRESLMMTASQHTEPNNQYGWGIINVMDAINYVEPLYDVNDDGITNVLDLVIVVNFIMGEETPTNEEFTTADANQDGALNVLDLVITVNYIVQ